MGLGAGVCPDHGGREAAVLLTGRDRGAGLPPLRPPTRHPSPHRAFGLHKYLAMTRSPGETARLRLLGLPQNPRCLRQRGEGPAGAGGGEGGQLDVVEAGGGAGQHPVPLAQEVVRGVAEHLVAAQRLGQRLGCLRLQRHALCQQIGKRGFD